MTAKTLTDTSKLITLDSGKQVILNTGVYPTRVKDTIPTSGLEDAFLDTADVAAIESFQNNANDVVTDADALEYLKELVNTNQQ